MNTTSVSVPQISEAENSIRGAVKGFLETNEITTPDWSDYDLIYTLYAEINESDNHLVFYDRLSSMRSGDGETVCATFYVPQHGKSLILEWEVLESFTSEADFIESVLQLEKAAAELLNKIH